jgi:hypothetical protein
MMTFQNGREQCWSDRQLEIVKLQLTQRLPHPHHKVHLSIPLTDVQAASPKIIEYLIQPKAPLSQQQQTNLLNLSPLQNHHLQEKHLPLHLDLDEPKVKIRLYQQASGVENLYHLRNQNQLQESKMELQGIAD